jgi:hypothetical protein
MRAQPTRRSTGPRESGALGRPARVCLFFPLRQGTGIKTLLLNTSQLRTFPSDVRARDLGLEVA